MHLYIAYKNYSSWSLRTWIAMKVANIPFEETILPFYHGDSLDKLGERFAIPAQVPVLEHDGAIVWDSLAIMEHLAEVYPDRQLWPESASLRTLARCVSSEMHSGFMNLRQACPMNCRSNKRLSKEQLALIQGDLERIAALWAKFEAVDKPEGDFLCGQFGIVDAMYAPVMWRVLGYGLDVSPAFNNWAKAMKALPEMQEWLAAAQQEEWVLDEYEACAETV
ncbi:glutathione S-transferase family protein [Leucothrix arctica]|uniref:Glutathione S-transferase n=1 Tax=Leucothrix arctica TaxID=1481894 RepID=A0A317CD06_9GAMM|nr:glutathione S-transferase family protein [Leucothrix arctica]PWQ96267.1 glutathione S-transferase [Leucothrix arctica]